MKKIKFFKEKEKIPINRSFQEWTGIKEIKNNKITLDNGKTVVTLKVAPVNFKLKSSLEQKSILNSYKMFLKNLNSKIQIIISSKKTNIYDHVEEILKFTKDNPQTKEMADDYIDLLQRIVLEKSSSTKEFYIVMEENNNTSNDELKIIEYLEGCGNEVVRANNLEIISLIRNYTNKRIEMLS